MSPSSNPPASERAIVCQRSGELAEFVTLLTTLGIPVEVVSGPLPSLEEIAGAALVIVAGQRLAEGKTPALQRWPRTIAVVDDGSRTLNAHLARIGVALIVRRPIPPRALRLLILHALYRGPERRSKGRVMIGQPIRAGVGLFKQNATLLELSRTGARIELASPPKIGTLIQFVLGKELTHGKPIKVQAKVVRAIRAADPAGRTTGEIGVALVDPSGEHARALQAILDRHGSSSATSIPMAGRGGPEAAPLRPFTTAATAASPQRGGPAASITASRPRPFATASLDALARTAATAIPAAPNGPKTMPNATSPSTSRVSAPVAAPTGPTAPSPAGDRAETPPEPSRHLPPSFVPQATVESLKTEVEVVVAGNGAGNAAGCAVECDVDRSTDLAYELDRLEGDESDLDFELELELDDELASDEALAADASDETLEDERRETARVPYTQRVVALDDQAARVVVGRDLSPGGMRIEPNPELVVGDVVKLALHAGCETQPLVVLAGVERDDGEDGLLLSFAALTAAQRERLEKILAATSSILSTDPLDEDQAGDSIVMGEVLRRVSRGNGGGHARAGFTLIELMIVAAIIGIIASVAIPVFARYQLRSKSSEVKSNLGAIRIVQEAHHSEHGRYLAAAAEPPLIPGPRAAAFDIVGTDYAEMGWSPEGRVYFSYAVATSPDASGYTADAAADIDGNGILQIWGYSKPDPLGALTPGGLGCNPAVLDAEEIGSCVIGAPTF